ncbi:hypothetical protein V8F20_004204 [Naviculisporaceae sp. PSN 640]
MDKLPTEILLEICRLLCPHCCKDDKGQGVQEMLRTSKKMFSSVKGEKGYDEMVTYMANTHLREQAESQAALAHLCLVSKSFNSIATPFLYHCLSEGRGSYKRTVHFLSVIGSNPDLASNVRSFCPVLCNFETMDHDDPLYPYDPFKIPRELGKPWALLPVRKGLDPLLVGLAWCADVEELVFNPHDLLITSEDYDDDAYWEYLPARGFPSLQTLELRADDSAARAEVLQLGGSPSLNLFAAAKQLETLKLGQILDINPDLPRLNNLRSIILTDCFLDRVSVKILLGRLPAIENFEYCSDWPAQHVFGPRGNNVEVTPYYLACQLYRRRKTLKRICIDQSWRRDFTSQGAVGLTKREVLPSFKCFPVLEELVVHADDVIPTRRSPPDDDVEMSDVSSEEEDVSGEPFYQEPKTKPSRTMAGERFSGLVPRSLQKLTVLGDCPFLECQGLFDKKVCGKGGDSLEKVVFGDIRRSDTLFGSYEDFMMELEDLKREAREEARVEFEVLADSNRNTFFDWLCGDGEGSGSGSDSDW